MKDFLIDILITPLIDKSLQIDLNKAHNLSVLCPELKVQFTSVPEGQYLVISLRGNYVVMSTVHESCISLATQDC